MKAFSKSLDKMEKRMRSPELRSAGVRKNNHKNAKRWLCKYIIFFGGPYEI